MPAQLDQGYVLPGRIWFAPKRKYQSRTPLPSRAEVDLHVFCNWEPLSGVDGTDLVEVDD
jgi:hypothetical protein